MRIHDSTGKFLGYQADIEEAEFVIIPFPYEFTTTFGKGTGRGPLKVLEVSDYLETYEEETGEEPYLRGIHTYEPVIADEFKGEEDIEKVGEIYLPLIEKRKKIITIGGEHSISYPIIKAFIKYYGNIGVIHFDAHGDYRNTYEGSPYNHACVMRRVADTGVKIVSAGIRAISKEEIDFVRASNSIKLFFAHEIHSDQRWIQKSLEFLPEKVYITIDVDALDPSLIRATGTPEPGGFEWYSFLTILKKIFQAKEVIGVDVVEICPDPPYEVSTYTVAKLIYKIIAYWK